MSKREPRTCTVADYECLAPAGYTNGSGGIFFGTKSCRGTCERCGDPVCSKCSKREVAVRFNINGKRSVKYRRVCFRCKPPLNPAIAL